MVITIDGPAGAGKSTAARRLAARLGIPYLDTGAMYRVVTLAALRAGVDLQDEAAVGGLASQDNYTLEPSSDGLRVILAGEDVTEAIRTMRVNDHTPYIAASPSVRRHLIDRQRAIANRLGSLVTEGRDQGTAAFPKAQMKFFLKADLDTRARRRLAEMPADERVTLDVVRENLRQRDLTDAARAVAPLVQPEDAIVVDTSNLSLDEVVQVMVDHLDQAGLFVEPGRNE
jgi:cytidylate kinase